MWKKEGKWRFQIFLNNEYKKKVIDLNPDI